jgi:IS605 OrfB family transposase
MVERYVVKAVVFRLKDRVHDIEIPDELVWLMKAFRLMVNEAIRAGLQLGLTSRYAICKAVYKGFRKDYDVYSQYIPSACEVAGTILKNHRRSVRPGKKPRQPFVKRLCLKCENQTYRLDRESGILDLPIRAREHVTIKLNVSPYHRKFLEDEKLALGSLTICPDKVIVAFRKDRPVKAPIETVMAFDTNERSLEGVFVSNDDEPLPIRYDTSEVPIIQERHQKRRKRLQQTKAHDRRTKQRLCGREGEREHDRIDDRQRKVALRIVSIAKVRNSAIILEDLTGMRYKGRSRELMRRLSSWPRRQLHRFICEYAEWYGVTVIFVDPWNTSNDCPVCGRRNTKSRKDGMFRCECGWECDQHISASLNILLKAIDSNEEVARAVKGRPDASWHDLMMSPYDLFTGARTEANRMSGMVGG